MVEYILGNYLVEEGKISSEQLAEVVGQLDKVRVKLGLIAVAKGIMTMEQADEVNRLQAVMDKRFGDIAIERGFLTDDQVGNLLKAQGNTYMSFVQALVDAELVKLDEMDGVLAGFAKKNALGMSDVEVLKTDDPELIIPLFLTPETLKYRENIGVAIRTMVRCVDRHVYIGKASLAVKRVISEAAIQTVDGDKGYTAAVEESEGGLLVLASKFGQEDFDFLDEDALDAAGEFLNCVNGLNASALSQKGEILELMPPELIIDSKDVVGEICSIPVYVDNKKLVLSIY